VALATTRMPFAFRTASYDLARAAVGAGQRPQPDEIRVEEFLAAQDYALPKAPAGGLALHVAGSESPWSGGNPRAARHLVQLVVQAASFDHATRYPNRLIVAVDASSQMRRDARMDAVRRALLKLADHMNDRDRVTLVRFAEQPVVLAKNATARQLTGLVASGGLSNPTGAANMAGAIHAAWETARDTTTLEPRQVVVLSGDRGNFDAAALARSVEQLRELADMNIPWRVVRLAAHEKDAHWPQLAETARGKVASARSPAEVYDALLEALVNSPTVVAQDVSLTVTFNPKVVSGYRLIGHEARTLTGLSTEPVTIDLRADQTPLCLYEITLQPAMENKTNPNEAACAVDIHWRHPPTNQPLRIARPILRKQVSGSFSQGPAWFQEAAIAAKAAEVLRGSYYAPTSRGLGQVLDVAKEVDPHLAAEPDFQQLVDLLKKVEKLR
jgi:Ca-activated chloride channel family protein